MHASKHSTTHLSFHPPIQIHHPPFLPTFHSSTFLPSPPFVHLSELHPAVHLPSCCVFNLWVHLCPRKTILPWIHLPIHLSIHSAYLLHAGSGAPLPQISCGSAAPSPPNHTKGHLLGSGWKILKVSGNWVCSRAYWEIIYLCSLENEGHSTSCWLYDPTEREK